MKHYFKPKGVLVKKALIYPLMIYCLLARTCLVLAKDLDKSTDMELLAPISEFKPLIADPKWPKFTMAYHHYLKGSYGEHIFSPNFGAVLPFVRGRSLGGTYYEWGMHAAIFSIMDIGSKPTRLINSDFFAGPILILQKNAWSQFFRISHTSSHLGDEFLLSKQAKGITRVNLSYEALETVVSYNFETGLRPYFGMSYLFDTDPQSYETAEILEGLDYRPNT